MANAKQCDICGKFYAAHKINPRRGCGGYEYSDTNLVRLYNLGPNLDIPNFDDPITFETCPECFNKISEFINLMKGD